MATYRNIVVLTGAGISAESGIRTFRDGDGLWENHRVEDVATPEAFVRNPALVHTFYNERRAQLLGDVSPNLGHRALAQFEQHFSGNFTLITQNVDNLHEQAGSENLLHMHGELMKMRCQRSGKVFDCDSVTHSDMNCECCDQKGNLRPHIVWFGEMPLYMDRIEQCLERCDLFLSIGTSGNVYPAAGFYQQAKLAGAHTVELNLEPSSNGSYFDEQHYGPATEVIPSYLETLLK